MIQNFTNFAETKGVYIDLFFLGYFIFINLYYLLLNTISLVEIVKLLLSRDILNDHKIFLGVERPISVLVPVHNEASGIITSIHSLLELNYPEFEIIVINDGSTDRSMEVLKQELELVGIPFYAPILLKTEKVRGVYQSKKYSSVRVIDKENGGKSDALNAGINLSRYPLFASIDADSVLEKNSLLKIGKIFIGDPLVIAAGGSVRPSNGCTIENGRLIKVDLPASRIAMVQIIEYLRSFLFSRISFSSMNAMLIVSGAFGLFKKEIVIEAGGYRTDTIGEDMELILRLHRLMIYKKEKYKIVYTPHPVCWTEVPESLRALQGQRIRWHRGCCESLAKNLKLFFNFRSPLLGWFVLPSFVFFEWLDPLLYIAGILWMVFHYLFTHHTFQIFYDFLFLAVSLGLLQSVNAFLLEEMFLPIFSKPKQLILLFFFSVIENLGYRQLNNVWRFMGFMNWVLVRQRRWHYMVRNAVK